MNLSFGEQIKILLGRENRTIKDFAEQVEAVTGVPCSRQNLTQKLKRDNFQEQDMRILASILGYEVQITLVPSEQPPFAVPAQEVSPAPEPDLNTDFVPDTDLIKSFLPKPAVSLWEDEIPEETALPEAEPLPDDCINPQTGKEYQNNTVRPHPDMDRYIQVYDQTEHTWTDISEEFFLQFQEHKQSVLGSDYVPPVYLEP